MNWSEFLVHTEFADKADCISEALNRANITTLLQLQNSPARLGHVCQADIYMLIAAVNRIFSEGIPVESESAESEEAEVAPEEEDVNGEE